MNKKIENIKKYRRFLLNQVSSLTVEQLNKIPNNYNNNIIWNIAHLISAQQGICYLRAGQQAIVPDKYISPFSTTTKPDRFIDMDEIEEIRKLFIDTIDRLHSDYDRKIFGNYTPSPNILRVYDIEIAGIDEALEFILYHEGYHGAYVLALKHLA
jgi:hypothetical protein